MGQMGAFPHEQILCVAKVLVPAPLFCFDPGPLDSAPSSADLCLRAGPWNSGCPKRGHDSHPCHLSLQGADLWRLHTPVTPTDTDMFQFLFPFLLEFKFLKGKALSYSAPLLSPRLVSKMPAIQLVLGKYLLNE